MDDDETTTEPMDEAELVEALAAYAHRAWSGWMHYLWSKCAKDADGQVVIPRWAVERWERQMWTEYADLPEAEKGSDRAEAVKMVAIMNTVKAKQAGE